MTAQDRRLAIVLAALPLFAQKGFTQTTTKELAKAAGVSEPILYRHFPSKEAIYLEIQAFSCRSTDPVVKQLTELDPSTANLVHLIYYLMRALILGKPAGVIEWKIRHRLMLSSLLEDGAFARLFYQSRFDSFCQRIEACLEKAIAVGDAVRTPIAKGNRARFAHHVGAWVALMHLPETPAMEYPVPREELLGQTVWFVLRGMGLTDKAMATYFNPKALAERFDTPTSHESPA